MAEAGVAAGAAVIAQFIRLMAEYAQRQKPPPWEPVQLGPGVRENLQRQLETMLSPEEIQRRVGDVRTSLGDVREKSISALTAQPYGATARQAGISENIRRGATQTEQAVNQVADELRRQNQNILQSVLGQEQQARQVALGEQSAARSAGMQNLAFERSQTGGADVAAGLGQALANAAGQYANVAARKRQQEFLNNLLQTAMENRYSPLQPKQGAESAAGATAGAEAQVGPDVLAWLRELFQSLFGGYGQAPAASIGGGGAGGAPFSSGSGSPSGGLRFSIPGQGGYGEENF